MKRVLYVRFLEATSRMLNLCVRRHWWWAAKPLIEFRRANIAKVLRKEFAAL